MQRTMLGVSVLALMIGTPALANDLFIEQVGTSNFAAGSQDGSNNETYVRQTGNRSSAGAAFTGNGNDGLIIQDTNSNRADWSFEDGVRSNTTHGIVQTGGDGNYASVVTSPAAGDSLTNSTVFFEQIGSRNEIAGGLSTTTSVGNGNTTGAQVTTSGLTAALEGPTAASLTGSPITDPTVGHQSAHVDGSGHFVGLQQAGNYNVASISVSGSLNTIGGPGTATHANLNGYTASGSFFDSPSALSANSQGVTGLGLQEGFGNQAALVQSGVNNAMAFGQIGSNQVAEVYQAGNGNLAIAVQNQ